MQCEEILGTTPDVVCACVGGGSNAIGIFSGFVDSDAELIGVEPAGGAAIGRGVPGVVHGMESFLMQDEFGQVLEAESISAGLDYPGVGPEHSYLSSTGRARYESVTDDEVIEAFQLLSRSEGLIPALEPAHALAWISREREYLAGKTVLLNLSGIILIFSVLTASMALSANGFMFTNHCIDIYGSTLLSHLSQ